MCAGGAGCDEPVADASEARVGVARVRSAPAVSSTRVTERLKEPNETIIE